MERRIRIKTLNPYITCKICKGYLIDATTVTECLHAFCKSCIVKHLEENNTCPTCQIVIHQSHPLQYISYDRTLQDIVYKLVPNLQDEEIRREKEFCKARSIPYSKLENSSQPTNQSESNTANNNHNNNHRDEEQVGIELVAYPDSSVKQIKQRYVKCSANLTITTLKKMLSQILFKNQDRHKEIDLLYNQELLGPQHTLKFVLVTRWTYKTEPLPLFYKLSKKRDY